VVSVLTTGPKSRRFKPGRGDGFLRAIKIRSTPSFGWEVKPEFPCRKILRYVKDPLTRQRYWIRKMLIPSLISPSRSRYLLVGLPATSGRRVRSYHHHDSPLIFTWGMNNKPVMAAVLRRQSHPIIISQRVSWQGARFPPVRPPVQTAAARRVCGAHETTSNGHGWLLFRGGGALNDHSTWFLLYRDMVLTWCLFKHRQHYYLFQLTFH
jgi:hypothetical protein